MINEENDFNERYEKNQQSLGGGHRERSNSKPSQQTNYNDYIITEKKPKQTSYNETIITEQKPKKLNINIMK